MYYEQSKKTALIPAYEPESLLNELLEKLRASGFEIVVVDDGSGPDYSEIFEKAVSCATLMILPSGFDSILTGIISMLCFAVGFLVVRGMDLAKSRHEQKINRMKGVKIQ